MKHFISLSIFTIIAIVAWWSITSDFGDDTQSPLIKSENYAEIFMNEFEMTVMDENGSPDFILNGAHLSRNAGSDDSNILQPEFQLLRQDNQWHIVAETAIVNDESETVQLNDNVVMRQKNKVPAVVIRTQHMLIHTDTQIARTEALVELTRGESRLRSNGMIFDNKTSELELLSDVNGYYLPHD
jgi:lipopolysaccharide export system protein LptC